VTAKGGSTLLFGVPSQDATMEVSPYDLFFTEVDYRGSYSLTTEDFERAVTMLEHGRVDADALITDEIGLDGITDAFDRMGDAEGLKKSVHPGDGA
jgi:NADPH2:quinone reductase